ncbi:MAG: hypothetical protein EP298_05840 [Gammaproteobacteria bacterium]|nr:MAG: hypothetical protein EP298_05840 [Gammaproteobacteria bacterium]UTW41423.1 hypothetical protein KFE69_07825 [bacterium SCSIO 12844]
MGRKVAYFILRGTGMGEYEDSLYKIYLSALSEAGEKHCFIYKGPGTYQNQSGWLGWVLPVEWYHYSMSYLGTITGSHGPNNWHDNIKDAIDKIKQMDPLPDELYFAGHSRGAITAFMLANELAKDKGLKHIKITIAGFDPVAGISGRYSQDQITLTDNVKSCHIFLASQCSLVGFTSIVPSVLKDTELKVYKVPTHHNGVIGLDIGWNVLSHASLDSDSAQLCLDYTLKQFNLNHQPKPLYRQPSEQDLSELSKGPNKLPYYKRVYMHKDSQTVILKNSEIEFLSKEHLKHEKRVMQIHSEIEQHNSNHSQKTKVVDIEDLDFLFYESETLTSSTSDLQVEYEN